MYFVLERLGLSGKVDECKPLAVTATAGLVAGLVAVTAGLVAAAVALSVGAGGQGLTLVHRSTLAHSMG